MTEISMLWATSTTGDGAVAGYSEDYTTGLFHHTLINDLTAEGPLKNYLNALAVTATSHAATPYVTVDTGAAWLYGFHYWNDAALDINVTLPVVGDTGFRVVLRATYGVTRTVRAAVVMNTDGVAAIPALTQTAGTLWEISLASGVVDTNGDIWMTAAKSVAGVTDLRTFVHPNIEVNAEMMEDRTRRFWVEPLAGYNSTDALSIVLDALAAGGGTLASIPLPDNKAAYAAGSFIVLDDYSSGLTVTAVVWKGGAASTLDCYCENDVNYGACGEDFQTHTDINGIAAHALVNTERNCIDELTLTNAAPGDMVSVRFIRDATNVLDTVGAAVYLLGWVVSYLADG